MNIFDRKNLIKLISCFLVLIATSCVEEIEIDRKTEKSLLVVEGLITDQLEPQTIRLSRSYSFNEEGPFPVSGASVFVESSAGEQFHFKESEPGTYQSEPFSTIAGVSYKLNLEVAGESYQSLDVKAQNDTRIDEIESIKTEYREKTGVAVLVSSTDESGAYYKYEYAETFQIKSRYRKSRDVLVDENDSLILVDKTREEYTCYNTQKSTRIILSDSEGLEANDIDNYLVRFISKDDYILSHRYSILVRQLKITSEIHSFYKSLKELSESENVFSQYQPGFLQGNIIPMGNQEENVIGVFGTASVDEKRHFFSYEDFFDTPETLRPTHYGPCDPFTEDIEVLKDLIEDGHVKFFDVQPVFPPIENLTVINARCVDCNFFGTNEKPDFWVDE